MMRERFHVLFCSFFQLPNDAPLSSLELLPNLARINAPRDVDHHHASHYFSVVIKCIIIIYIYQCCCWMVLYSYEEPLVPFQIYMYIQKERERELSQFWLQFQESGRQFRFCKSDLVLVCILPIKVHRCIYGVGISYYQLQQGIRFRVQKL